MEAPVTATNTATADSPSATVATRRSSTGCTSTPAVRSADSARSSSAVRSFDGVGAYQRLEPIRSVQRDDVPMVDGRDPVGALGLVQVLSHFQVGVANTTTLSW
jgi:hypothetical protein